MKNKCSYQVDDDNIDEFRNPINELSSDYKVPQKPLEINIAMTQAVKKLNNENLNVSESIFAYCDEKLDCIQAI